MTSKQSLRDKCRTQKYVKMQTAKAGKISIINSFEEVSCSKVSFHAKTRSKFGLIFLNAELLALTRAKSLTLQPNT